MIERCIKLSMRFILFSLEKLDKVIIKKGIQNKQFVLNFYDDINEISVRR